MSDRPCTTHPLTLIRLSLVIVTFVLGHDILMAMDAHGQDTESSHHGMVIEWCGVEDGNLHSTNVLPSHADTDDVQIMPWYGWLNARASSHQPLVQDISPSRAFLQVFLN